MRSEPFAQSYLKMTPWAHLKVKPAIVDCGLGAAAVNSELPTFVNEERSVRTSLAKRTEPSMFSSPAPCSNMLKFANGWAVYMRIVLIMLGVSFGFASRRTATAPATIGLETEVPLR